ncbi:hypothetical protein L208DRAFT_1282337, partial [Tricholoma matsutake]
ALVVHGKDGILTLYDAPFQETCTWSGADSTSLDYNLEGHKDHQILNLNFSHFTCSY